jgi:hypothetical protein
MKCCGKNRAPRPLGNDSTADKNFPDLHAARKLILAGSLHHEFGYL